MSRSQQLSEASLKANGSALENVTYCSADGFEGLSKICLLYLNASRWMKRDELSRRFIRVQPFLEAGEQARLEQERLCVHLSLMKACVGGRTVCFRSRFVCEGQLARSVVGSKSVLQLFGTLEAWIAVVSQLVPMSALEHAYRLLGSLYEHTVARRGLSFCFNNAVGAKQRENFGKAGDVLYTRVCLALVECRSHCPIGHYVLADEDIAWGRIINTRSLKYPYALKGNRCGRIPELVDMF